MIAVDSSTLIAFIQGEPGSDVDAFDRGLASGDIMLPPPVITEILSDPSLPAGHRRLIISLPVMELLAGYWARAADTRRAIIAKKLRARSRRHPHRPMLHRPRRRPDHPRQGLPTFLQALRPEARLTPGSGPSTARSANGRLRTPRRSQHRLPRGLPSPCLRRLDSQTKCDTGYVRGRYGNKVQSPHA